MLAERTLRWWADRPLPLAPHLGTAPLAPHLGTAPLHVTIVFIVVTIVTLVLLLMIDVFSASIPNHIGIFSLL